MLYRYFQCLFLVLISSSFAFGNYSKLLEKPFRPTTKELIEELQPMPKTNPFRPLYTNDRSLRLIPILAPKMIVQLEFVYPGAVWAPLGRDTALVADILESYYLAVGQKNRVVRLHASRNSFRDQSDFNKLLVTAGLINSNGLPLKKFIILDITQWNLYSQSRQLISAVYSALPTWERSKYLPIVNAVALGYLGGELEISRRITPNLNKLDFFNQLFVGEYGPNQILETYQNFTYPEQYHS